jgi:hypothetical protein
MTDGLLGKLKDEFGNEIDSSIMDGSKPGMSNLASVREDSADNTKRGDETTRTGQSFIPY